MINFSPFKTRTFKIAVLGSLWIRITTSSFPFILPLLLQINFGYSAFISGLLIVPYGLGLIMAKFFVKPLLKHWGYRKLLLINPWIIAIISLSFSFITPQSPVLLITLLCFLGGISCSLQFSAMQTLNYIDTQTQEKSKATSLASLSQQLAVNLSICLTALFLEYFNHAINTKISLYAFHNSFILLAIIAASSTIIFRLLKKTDGLNAIHKTNS